MELKQKFLFRSFDGLDAGSSTGLGYLNFLFE